MESARSPLERRVLVLTPTAKDGALTSEVLTRAGFSAVLCTDLRNVCDELESGAAALLLPEEAVDLERADWLTLWLTRQPPWSDLPILLLARAGADSPAIAQAMDRLGNVTVLERPLRVTTLVSAVRVALRGRQRQYRAREQLARLRRSEAELRDFFEYAAIGLLWTDRDGNVLRVNRSELEMLGHSGDEVLGKPVASFHADPAGIEQLERRLASGETIHDHEAELLRRDGSRRRVLIDANGSWESGEFAYARWFMRDVTERRVAEELLRHSEARFRSLVSILSDVTWVADEHGGFASRQLEWEAYTGQRWPEHQGFGFANAFHPDDRERLISAWRDVCSSGASFEAPGRIWHAPSKTWRHFVARATQLDPAGRPREWVGTCVDVDESVRAAEALREADRRKDEFLAILAHELRNPLAPIRNSLHILRLSSQGDPATTRVGEMVERQVNHMVRLIDDLMEVSRITRGKIELRKETLEIGGIVRAAIESSRPLIDARRLQLAVELPPEPLTLDGDAVRLTQVVTNLLNNATKFTEPSGRIRVAVRRESDRVAISVSDTGAGIPREMLTRVFDLFTQGGADRSQGGLGIGLALVKTLVELHGGSVTARSDGPGAGSEFLVRLPLDTAGRRDEPSAEHAPRRPTRRSRVLVVDDNRDGAESLGRLLELLGAEVRTEYGGQAALDMIGSYRPALVLLDIGMPELDGYEVARRIRERPELRDVTLVALTGWGQEADRLRSRRAGFDRHLVKPAAIGDLEALLASLEDGSRPVSAAATGVATSGPAARV